MIEIEIQPHYLLSINARLISKNKFLFNKLFFVVDDEHLPENEYDYFLSTYHEQQY
jgi:hypothetical protein